MIDVSSTAVEKLPDPITHLKEVAALYLTCCEKLTNLPEQLGDMKGLKELEAGETAITQLPDSITQLKELFRLDLHGCRKLGKIPEHIGNLESLRTFSARDTAIGQLPDSFGGLINLESLDLSCCKNLRNLPHSIWKLKLLKQLQLSECSKLEQLPERLGEMQCLEFLYASGTALEKVPGSIGLLSRLKLLNLSGCRKLKYVPESVWNLNSIEHLYLEWGDAGIRLPDLVEKLNKLRSLRLSFNVRLCLPMFLCSSYSGYLILIDEGPILSSAEPVSLSQLSDLQTLALIKCTSLGSSLPQLPLKLEWLSLCDHSLLEQLPDLSSLKLLERLDIRRCISLQSISLLPYHLSSLSVQECTSLQELPDLSVLKGLEYLRFTRCSNLKSISLKQSSLQVGQPRLPFRTYLPNREVAKWFTYKSSGRTVSFDISPSFGSNFLGLALWVVYTCKATNEDDACIRAIITNSTEGITENYRIWVHTEVGEAQSRIQCIRGENILMESGDGIKVSIQSKMYSDSEIKEPIRGEGKVKMFGVHVIQGGPST